MSQVVEQNKSDTTYATGDFVSAVYVKNWYVGKIVDTDEDDSRLDYEVSIMENTNNYLFQWPQKDDTVWCSEQVILCKISAPIACDYSKECTRFRMMALE